MGFGVANPFAQYMQGINPNNIIASLGLGAGGTGTPLPTPTPQQLQSQVTPNVPAPSIMQTNSGFQPPAALTAGTTGQQAITQPQNLPGMLASGGAQNAAASAAGPSTVGGGLAATLSKMYPWLMAISMLQGSETTPSASFGGGRAGYFG